MKELIKKILPRVIFRKLQELKSKQILKNEFEQDFKRYFHHSDYFNHSTREKYLSRIIHRYHPIEKGLCMPQMKFNFGKDNIIALIKDCHYYHEHYYQKGKNSEYHDSQFIEAIRILKEYQEIHKTNKVELELKDEINSIINCFKDQTPSKQIKLEGSSDMWSFDFENFLRSRRSIRNFSSIPIQKEKVHKALEIAKYYPSACNRQPGRASIVESEHIIQTVLRLQGGNRGFGHLVDKVIIVTSELSGYRGVVERNGVYIDGTIYAYNLLLSLHSQGIATCPLNWYNTTENDQELRKICNIPQSQVVIMLIACGSYHSDTLITTSPKNNIEKCVQII